MHEKKTLDGHALLLRAHSGCCCSVSVRHESTESVERRCHALHRKEYSGRLHSVFAECEAVFRCIIVDSVPTLLELHFRCTALQRLHPARYLQRVHSREAFTVLDPVPRKLCSAVHDPLPFSQHSRVGVVAFSPRYA